MLVYFVSFSDATGLIHMIFPPIPNSSFIPTPYNGSGMDTVDQSDWSFVYLYLAQKPGSAIVAVSNHTQLSCMHEGRQAMHRRHGLYQRKCELLLGGMQAMHT
jgi:hypothetical protein